MIAFLVYAVLVKVESEIENYWSVKTICHGLSRNRPGIRQFMKDKPTKWGINLWVATDSSNGYTCDFEIYTGMKSIDSSQHGLGYDVVM